LIAARGESGEIEDGRVFGGPFNRDALMQSNYMAIHAVSFHRSLVF